MTNKQIAQLLYNIADFLELQNIPYKPRAYQKAAGTVESYGQSIQNLYKTCGRKCLDDLPGIGESISKKIEEAVKTGHIKLLDRLQKKFPFEIRSLTQVEGIGPQKAYELYKKLKVKSVKDLGKAAKEGRLAKTKGFSKKSEENIIAALGFLANNKGRFLLGEILPYAEKIVEQLREIKEVKHCEIAGSIRRRKETIGDIDIVVTASNSKKIMDAFKKFKQVARVRKQGSRFMAVTYDNKIHGDLLVIDDKVWGAALIHYTGSKYHNIQIRTLAKKKGWLLSEEGLKAGNKLLAGKSEQQVYKKLGMQWMPPEIRTASGEVQAALKNKIPPLVPYGSLKGDLQVQTKRTDGKHGIEEMVLAAKNIGLEYIAITDHTKSLAMANGMNEQDLEKQAKEIDALNKKIKGFRILKSAEVNVLKDGRLDINNKALKKLDVVSVAVHSNFKMPKREMTERIIRAMKNPYVHILFHPTGRLLKQRPSYRLDMPKIIKAAKRYKVALEVNAYPSRLDLRDQHIRMAVEHGVKLVINSDAHHRNDFGYLNLGIAQARRGWAKKSDVLNTKSVTEFLKAIKK